MMANPSLERWFDHGSMMFLRWLNRFDRWLNINNLVDDGWRWLKKFIFVPVRIQHQPPRQPPGSLGAVWPRPDERGRTDVALELSTKVTNRSEDLWPMWCPCDVHVMPMSYKPRAPRPYTPDYEDDKAFAVFQRTAGLVRNLERQWYYPNVDSLTDTEAVRQIGW